VFDLDSVVLEIFNKRKRMINRKSYCFEWANKRLRSKLRRRMLWGREIIQKYNNENIKKTYIQTYHFFLLLFSVW